MRLFGIDFPTIDGILYGSLWGYPAVEVYASNVIISGFIIQHTPPYPKELDHGILIGGNNCIVSGNVIRFDSEGVGPSISHIHTAQKPS